MNSGGKIVRMGDIATLSQQVGTKKSILAGGCFDIFHYGHHYFLSRAKQLGEILIVLLESDSFIEKIKHKKPVHTQAQRAEILASLMYVDFVVLLEPMENPDKEYEVITRGIHPSVIVYTTGDRALTKKQTIAATIGATLTEIQFISAFSSSQLITYAPIFRD
jgi:cytidyltransferase-like protein